MNVKTVVITVETKPLAVVAVNERVISIRHQLRVDVRQVDHPALEIEFEDVLAFDDDRARYLVLKIPALEDRQGCSVFAGVGKFAGDADAVHGHAVVELP